MAKQPAAKKKAATPPKSKNPAAYDRGIAEAVLAELAAGHSLRKVCAQDGMPAITTFMRWMAEEGEAGDILRKQYARAREAQAETMAEEILAIADEECTTVRADKHGSRGDDRSGDVEVVFDATAVARNRLRVDARKWLLSKMAPKKYGDKIQAEHTGAGGAPIAIASTVTFVQPPVYAEDDE